MSKRRKPKPRRSKPRLSAALSAYRDERFDEAESILASLLQDDIPDSRVAHLRGLTAIRRSDVALAEKMLRLATKLDPSSADALSDLGNLLDAEGKSEEAIQCYRRALSVAPDHTQAGRNLGLTLIDLNRPQEALDVFNNALRRKSDDEQLLLSKAKLLVSLERPDDAIAAFYVRNYLSEQPRPMNTTKTYGADGNKFKHTDQDAIERFWRHLLAGAASIRFHRPDSGLGINDKAVACIRAARRVEQLVPFWNLEPANHLLGKRTDNEAYAASTRDGNIGVVYFPATKKERSVTLDKGKSSTQARIQWINIDTGEPAQRGQPLLAALSPPSQGNFVAVLTKRTENRR